MAIDKNTLNKNVKVVEMDFYLFSELISDIGGTFSAIFGIFAALMGLIHTMKWEDNILFSVFGRWKIEAQTVTLFKRRLSYFGIFHLHEQVENINKDLKNELQETKRVVIE